MTAIKSLWYWLFLPLLLGGISTGCVKPPEFSIIPFITFESISKDTINVLNGERLNVVITFEDGDGDLGRNAIDSTQTCRNTCDSSCLQSGFNAFLRDSRTQCYFPYLIPVIPSKGSSPSISGRIFLDSIPVDFCLGLDSFEFLQFWVTIKDNAGHFSNEVITDTLVLRCR